MDDDIEMEDMTQKKDQHKKEDSTIIIHKKRKCFIKEKLHVVELARQKGKHYASKTFNIDSKSLRELEKKEVNLK